MRGFWWARQKSLGCISLHAWKLPLVMALCILVYALPLSLAVSVEPSSGPRPSPDDSPHCRSNQLVAPPGNRSTFDVTYLGALTDKWLGWTPLWSEPSICNKPSKQPLFGDTHLPLHGGKPVVPVFKFVVLLLLLLLAGDIESNPGPVTVLTPHNLNTLFCCLCSLAASWKEIGQELGVHLETKWTLSQKNLEPIALLLQILHSWLNSSDTSSDQFKEQPTLEKLCSALRSPSIMGGEGVASNLEQHWNQRVVEFQELPEDLKQHELHEVQVLDIVPVDVSPCVLRKANYRGKDCLIICYCPTQTTKEGNTAQYSEYLGNCFQVKHDNVAQILGVYCLPNSLYPAVVIEEVEPLSTIVKDKDFSEKQQISILVDIAHALSAFAAVPSPVLVKVVWNAVFISTSPEDLTAKFYPIFECSYCLVVNDTNKQISSLTIIQCLYEITMFLKSQGQTVEGDLPTDHVLRPVFHSWFWKSLPLATVTEQLEHLFQEVSLRDATLEEFSPENLVEVTHLHMILIGHTGVGKTSVVKHLKGEKIDPDENSTEVMEQQLLIRRPKQPELLIRETLVSSLDGTGFFVQENKYYKPDPGKFYLNVWDTGGQSMFQDLLPCFAKLRSLYGVVFKLTDDLDSIPETSFRFGRQKHSTGPCPYSNKDLIYRCLGYIEMFSSSIKDTIPRLPSEIVDILCLEHKEQVFPRAVLIGTHADHFNKPRMVQERKTLLAKLVTFTESLEKVKCLCSKTHYPTESPFQVAVYMLDNMKAGRRDEIDEGLQVFVEDIGMLAERTTVKVPKNWLNFKQRLEEVCKSNYPNGIIPFRDVEKIAEKCHISNVIAPLIYFHELGFFLWYYYSNRPILKDYVVLYPEKLLRALARIFDARGYGSFPCEWAKLKSKGILEKKLSDHCLDEQKTGISTQWVLEFLTEHYVASPIDHKVLGKGHFIPSMLPHCVKLDHLVEPTSSLYIVLNAGFVPPGLFPKLVTILSDNNLNLGTGQWMPCEKLYRNQVKFEVQQNYYRVLLTEHVDCIQVECCPPPSETPDPQVYRTVCNVLDVCLFRTVPKWIYKREYQFAFACTDASHHLLPAASIADLKVTCSQHHTMQLTEGQLLWLGIGRTMSNDDLTPELSDLLSELHGVSSKWRLIGLCLEPKIGSDANGTLNSIMASRPGQPVIEYLSETLDCWLKNGDRKPSWKGIVAALRNPCVNEKRLAQKLEQKYCTIPCTSRKLQQPLQLRHNTEIPSFRKLINELRCIPNWYLLGISLGIKSFELDIIEKNHRDTHRSFFEMLQVWLKQSPQPTWEAIVEALSNIEERRLAEEIRAKYCHNPTI